MKKLLLLACIPLSFSCKKTYNCDCEKYLSVTTQDSTYVYEEKVFTEIEDTEKKAKETCEAKNRNTDDGNGNIDRLECSLSTSE
ncbi:MAG: hypothetical protein MRY83_21070 [Flavobacteriales bacterium]|nr:hypothetical protein [Flavobacteriales bacterium]